MNKMGNKLIIIKKDVVWVMGTLEFGEKIFRKK